MARGKNAASKAHKLADEIEQAERRQRREVAQLKSQFKERERYLEARIATLEGKLLQEVANLAEVRVNQAQKDAKLRLEREQAMVGDAIRLAFSQLLLAEGAESIGRVGAASKILSRWVKVGTLLPTEGATREERRNQRQNLKTKHTAEQAARQAGAS